EELERLAAGSDGTITVTELPAPPGPRYRPAVRRVPDLRCRALGRPLGRSWRSSSFSALVSSASLSHEAVAGRDLDEAGDGGEPLQGAGMGPGETIELHDFPRGARAGNLLHAIFEQLDFREVDAAAKDELIRGALRRFGFEGHWLEVLRRTVDATLDTPLGGRTGPRLREVAPDDRLTELEFVFPVAQVAGARLDPAQLASAFSNHATELSDYAAHLAALRFPALQGYLRGFVDLAFEHEGRWYVVDYKSNFLGPHPQDYRLESMRRAMGEHHYILQYHLYVLALHRYLSLRVPAYAYDQSFGGVFYLFVRGMSPASPELGVFADRPPGALIEALSGLMGRAGDPR
ncbi:MAG: PD-(D/E)XK nuclease family protein, partial [bacterium]